MNGSPSPSIQPSRFKTYAETAHRDWTIQHTWKTSLERPGPDGFDRVAVRGLQRIAQGTRTWTDFIRELDVMDGFSFVVARPSEDQKARVEPRAQAIPKSQKRQVKQEMCTQPSLFEEELATSAQVVSLVKANISNH